MGISAISYVMGNRLFKIKWPLKSIFIAVMCVLVTFLGNSLNRSILRMFLISWIPVVIITIPSIVFKSVFAQC
jgi:uncharacterized membrane protein AbrB (regulator of aidB expression)